MVTNCGRIIQCDRTASSTSKPGEDQKKQSIITLPYTRSRIQNTATKNTFIIMTKTRYYPILSIFVSRGRPKKTVPFYSAYKPAEETDGRNKYSVSWVWRHTGWTVCWGCVGWTRTVSWSSTSEPAKPYCTASHQPHHCLHTVLHATHRQNNIYTKYILQETRPPQIPNCIFSSHDKCHTMRRRYDR